MKVYSKSPQDHRNSFKLALYHLAAGNMAHATQLYQTTVQQIPSIQRIKEAIRDLDDLPTILPHYPNAEEIHRPLTNVGSRSSAFTQSQLPNLA